MIEQCRLCIRRPRQLDGLGDCVIFKGRLIRESKKGNDVRESFYDGFEHHVDLMRGRQCSAFKPGDRRTSRPVPQLAELGMAQEALF